MTCSLQLQKRALTNSHTRLLGDPGGNLLGTAAWCVLSNFKKGSLKKNPILILCQVNPLLGEPCGHAPEGPAVGAISDMFPNFKRHLYKT